MDDEYRREYDEGFRIGYEQQQKKILRHMRNQDIRDEKIKEYTTFDPKEILKNEYHPMILKKVADFIDEGIYGMSESDDLPEWELHTEEEDERSLGDATEEESKDIEALERVIARWIRRGNLYGINPNWKLTIRD